MDAACTRSSDMYQRLSHCWANEVGDAAMNGGYRIGEEHPGTTGRTCRAERGLSTHLTPEREGSCCVYLVTDADYYSVSL